MISVILPVRNEGKRIRHALDAILDQDYPKDNVEIIIADGLSTDETRAIIEEYQNKQSSIQLIDNPGEIVPTGINLAIRKSKGEIIIRVDGHCIIEKDYISRCVHHLRNDNVHGVGGPMETIGETNLSKTIALAMSSSFGVGNSAFRTTFGKTMLVDTVPFPAYTREIIHKVGLYDEELVRNQDDEYNYRIREFGGKLLLAADVRSKYFSRGTLLKLWKQYFQYGFFKIRVLQKHPRQMSLRQFIPPIFVLVLVISSVLAVLTTWGPWLLRLSAGSYFIANIIASISSSLKKGWNHLSLLPIVFLIIHLSYGLGFLAGLIKFWNRWSDKVGKVPQM